MHAHLSRIRSKLDRYRNLDRESPRLDAQGIARLETAYGVVLPEELRMFLEHVHGGGPGPGYGLDIYTPASPLPRTARPFPYTNADAAALMERQLYEPDASLPLADEEKEDHDRPPGPGFIPLAHHGCGVFDVIVVTGEQRGRMWCCDMAWRPCHTEGKQWGLLDWYEDWIDGSLGTF